MLDYLTLKGVTHIFKDNLASNLLYGTLDFFKWAILGAGGFQNITYNPAISGVFGGNRSRLRPINDPRYVANTVYEGFRSDWVWESGITGSIQPIRNSGIYVNNSLVNSGYYIDYPRGRVIFDTPQSGNVNSSFSHRIVGFKPAFDSIVPELFFSSYHNESTNFLTGSGDYGILSDLKRQLPLICLDISSNRSFEPYQLGGGQWCSCQGIFYIMAESSWEKDSLVDLISLQNDKSFFIPDRATIKENNRYPLDLDYKGSLVSNPMEYPEIIEKFSWRLVSFSDTRAHNYSPKIYRGINLYLGVVTTTFVIPMENI